MQNAVIEFILNKGGTDKYASGFIFHFRTYDSIMVCRESMLDAVPGAFHEAHRNFTI